MGRSSAMVLTLSSACSWRTGRDLNCLSAETGPSFALYPKVYLHASLCLSLTHAGAASNSLLKVLLTKGGGCSWTLGSLLRCLAWVLAIVDRNLDRHLVTRCRGLAGLLACASRALSVWASVIVDLSYTGRAVSGDRGGLLPSVIWQGMAAVAVLVPMPMLILVMMVLVANA